VHFSHPVAIGGVRRDQSDDSDDAGIGEQACHMSAAASILAPCRPAEAEVPVEPVSQVVAVEQVTGTTLRDEAFLNTGTDGGVASAGRPVSQTVAPP